jgi:hypothetical protein
MSTQYRLIRSIECVLVPQVMISSDFTFTSGVWLPASYEPPILEWRLFLFTGKVGEVSWTMEYTRMATDYDHSPSVRRATRNGQG